MSLINNMLKDLEKRKARQTQLSNITFANVQQRSSMVTTYKKIIISSIFFIIVSSIITLLLVHAYRTPRLANIPDKQVTKKSSLILTTKENMEWIQPVSIIGITLQVKDNITEISFLLDHVALYRIINSGLPNQLSLIIDHAQLKSELPAINHLNTAIQRITTQAINGDTRFTLYTYPGATIKYLNLNNENNNPELIVAIEYQTTNINLSKNSSVNPIITPTLQGYLSQQYQLVLEAIKNGQNTETIDQLTNILKINPHFADARVSLAAVLIDNKKLHQAKQLIDAGLKLNPQHVPFVELKARILTTEGNTEQALALLQGVSPSIDENPDYYAMMAALYEHTNNNLLAVKIYRQLLTQNPFNGNWWFGLGMVLEKLGQIKAASDAYTRALTRGQLNPKSVIYLQRHLQTLKETNDDKR